MSATRLIAKIANRTVGGASRPSKTNQSTLGVGTHNNSRAPVSPHPLELPTMWSQRNRDPRQSDSHQTLPHRWHPVSTMKLCSSRFFVKVKSVCILIVASSCLIPLITVLNHRPSLLKTYRTVNFQILTRIPGSFLKSRGPANDSYCKFNYGLPWRFDVSAEKLDYPPELGQKSPYRVLYNVLESNQNSFLPPVTYATHSSPEFFNYLAEVVTHWEGPISIAVFVPDSDADVVVRQLLVLCHCLADMSKVSVHFVFPAREPPFVAVPQVARPIQTCNLRDTSVQQSYRTRNRLSYPVNVCRNAAKIASDTHHVLVSDLELVPSEGLASRFLKMIEKASKRLVNPSVVYVVPVFEIERYEEMPRSKSRLMELVKDERAVYFHRHLCFHCQKFPGLQNWLQDDPGDVIKVKILEEFY